MLNSRHLNIGGLSFLLADPNQHSAAIIHSILRGFGAKRVIEARNRIDAIQVLTDQKIDMMLIEPRLPEGGAFPFIYSIRQKSEQSLSHHADPGGHRGCEDFRDQGGP